MNKPDFILRTIPGPQDPARIREIVSSTGFFREDEIRVAVELVEEWLAKGEASGYEFFFADIDGKPVAYSCYGLIPCTLHSYDLYWIATHQDFKNRGIGRTLLRETEKAIQKAGGITIYVETSSRDQYTPTRAFYDNNGYIVKARYEDFYDRGDDRIVYIKKV
jgi:ribosomal protein S18 acetylase RimI-like enzyme